MFRRKHLEEPYLAEYRLPNLIAAIQAMGTKGWGSLPIEQWVQEFEGAEEMAPEKRHENNVDDKHRKKWRDIFFEHPEFFKLYKLDGNERVALRWRFAHTIDYDPTTSRTLSSDELKLIPKDDKFYATYTRRPLTADEINVLIKTAIDLHGRILAAQQESRWHLPIISSVVTALGALLGAAAGVYLKK